VEQGNKGFPGIHSLILYRVRNSFEALPGFGGPAKGNSLRLGPIIQEEQKMGSSKTIRNILNFRIQKV